jgi:hypothetical protein
MSPHPAPAPQIDTTTYFFNARELARLSVYRAAVVARFYTDQCEPIKVRRGIDAARLLDSVRRDLRAA